MKIKNALFSTYNKSGVVEFAQKLNTLGIQIIATGKTEAILNEHHLQVMTVEDTTHFPEILDGRVKTLHPNIHGGILFKRNNQDHQETLLKHNIKSIDMVIVNLYPFEQTIANAASTLDQAIEQIDIGGPTMIRAAAKNYKDVVILVEAEDFELVWQELQLHQDVSLATRLYLATKAFNIIAHYDHCIANYFNTLTPQNNLPQKIILELDKKQILRYGENPHQDAAVYQIPNPIQNVLANHVQIQGKDLSYNNILDAQAALQCIAEFSNQPTVAVIKHNNPCGVASDESLAIAFQKAQAADPISIFGGIIITNETLDIETAHLLSPLFLEIVMAPAFEPQALVILKSKKNLRVLTYNIDEIHKPLTQIKSIFNGYLVQRSNNQLLDTFNLKSASDYEATPEQLSDLLFALKVVKHVNSNAIVIAENQATTGIGAGQMNRIQSAEIALKQTALKPNIVNPVLASDAFFPFRDVVDLAHEFGIKAIMQPGGSINDSQVIAACKAFKIPLYFTGIRHFKH
ncbi:MAG: bifunctional phosphoribosylaminoimidazolecarboxamide formyltransferase/IMP cyclohydrolase [Alphaproteobacteria bacterium]|nr:bifunctional phosphoribosylaminoimidazolecarboxamide formyltransferase/IMP cyclohydrolase [Alphaproteobacteria bacterium]